jgi:hypothetical protein
MSLSVKNQIFPVSHECFKKYIKKDWRKARKIYVPSTVSPETVAPKICPKVYYLK